MPPFHRPAAEPTLAAGQPVPRMALPGAAPTPAHTATPCEVPMADHEPNGSFCDRSPRLPPAARLNHPLRRHPEETASTDLCESDLRAGERRASRVTRCPPGPASSVPGRHGVHHGHTGRISKTNHGGTENTEISTDKNTSVPTQLTLSMATGRPEQPNHATGQQPPLTDTARLLQAT